MESKKQISKGRLWVSFILQGIIVFMFLMGAVMNILGTEQAIDGAVTMGYPKSSVLYLGLILLISTLLDLYLKTSGLGAVLLTGWLGGAVATHIINGYPLFNTFFPIVLVSSYGWPYC